MEWVCAESYFRTDQSTAFSKDMLIFKKQNNIDSLKRVPRLKLPFTLNSSKSKTLC